MLEDLWSPNQDRYDEDPVMDRPHAAHEPTIHREMNIRLRP
jgi:hypothetical protein